MSELLVPFAYDYMLKAMWVSGLVGAHSHYFLFKGSTMISIIFQALPDGHFARLAPLFDRVAGSLRVL